VLSDEFTRPFRPATERPRDKLHYNSKNDMTQNNGSIIPANAYLHTLSSVAPITQQLLERFQELGDLKKEHGALRLQLIGMLQQGAAIEPGGLTLDLHTSETRRLTVAALTAALAPEFVEQLRAQIPPQVNHRLTVKATRMAQSQRSRRSARGGDNQRGYYSA
jgi:hypothetical protein